MWGYYASPGERNLRRGCGPLRSKACELVPRRRHALGRRHRQPQPQPALDHSPPGHRWWPSRFRATSAASNRSDGTRFTRLTSTPGGDGDPDWCLTGRASRSSPLASLQNGRHRDDGSRPHARHSDQWDQSEPGAAVHAAGTRSRPRTSRMTGATTQAFSL